MATALSEQIVLDPETRAFYRAGLEMLQQSGIPFLLGGAYGLQRYTGVQRHTKDLDVFVRPDDCRRVLDLFDAAGYRTEMTFSHWLGKVFGDTGDFIDVIFSSGNGLCRVDDDWFAHAVAGEVLEMPVRLCPPEEMIWSKAFILERERYDGADVAHLLRSKGHELDWQRLRARFGPNWPVLLSHLILFQYIYPDDRDQIPSEVFDDLLSRAHVQPVNGTVAGAPLCRGTFLSRGQYLPDIEQWGYEDARLSRPGTMTPEQVQRWTEAINE